MPITLASDPLPEQFTFSKDSIRKVINFLTWYENTPDWFEYEDSQYDAINGYPRTVLVETPEWNTLTDEQKDWRWEFGVVPEGYATGLESNSLYVVTDESEVPIPVRLAKES